MSYASVRGRGRATRVAVLVGAVLALGGAAVPASPVAAASTAGDGCTVSDAALVWGFKESFRAYIDGSIANGEWTTAGDASYDTPLFTWQGGAGSERGGELTVRFSGSVRFTGHGGVLDTTVEDPRVVIGGGRSVLLLDVHGTTQAGEAVDAAGVEFVELDLAAAERTRDGERRALIGIPAVLTVAGAEAFGTYSAGEALDPITLTATVEGDCGVLDAGQPAWGTVLIAVFVGVTVLSAAALVTVIVRRRRRRPSSLSA
ncbi:MAG: HtaA domain-containing protein [Protaetiibacter sp.]